ncbi:cystatin-like [Eleutherodactylus coqui]|uniref:Cystatin domain-containing protein n=1 Tax=Eleutherodactylus coqui TaxID=57060 RepID=A0A8J6FB65_ELECQ|nr:hypothetical protein GDO78_009953 [Eleutherodactylus coqui]
MAVIWKICLVVTLALCSQVFAQNKKLGLMGGWREANENDKDVQRILQFVKEEYNKYSNDGYITGIHRVIRVQKQVVAGMKYKIEVEAVFCPHYKPNTEECQIENVTKKKCAFDVLTIPWQGVKELRHSSCM